jgi:hypothetical protein
MLSQIHLKLKIYLVIICTGFLAHKKKSYERANKAEMYPCFIGLLRNAYYEFTRTTIITIGQAPNTLLAQNSEFDF